jgi:hypothetical protein
LKKEFALSDLEVVLRIPERGISIKYAGTHDSRMAKLLAIHSFLSRAYLVMKAFYRDSNSSPFSEPHTQAFRIGQKSLSLLVEWPTHA